MEKSYTETFALRTPMCDMSGRWRPGAVLESMQETAGEHCARLGIVRSVMDGLGIAWVLSRSRVALYRAPRLNEVISVETWPLPPRHQFYPRINAFRDAGGNVIGEATSLWLLMDLTTRRVVNSDEVLAHLPDNADMPASIPLGAARALAGEAIEGAFVPPYADFDLNGHANNTKYLDWTCSALGHGVMAKYRLAEFTISYEREIRPDEAIRTQLVRQGEAFSFCGFAGDRRCFCIAGKLAERE